MSAASSSIARYGRSHRAVKLYTAEQAGAAGIVIYSDPADDGFARGETWPDGLWRAESFQRGNGKYSWFWHGDPLTPGVAATAERRAARSSGGAHAAAGFPRPCCRGAKRGRSFERSPARRRRPDFRAGCRSRIAPGPARSACGLACTWTRPRPIRDVVAPRAGARQPTEALSSARTTTRGRSAA